MPWFRVDDNFSHHAKVMAAGNAAVGLWVRAGAWSMQQLTDGHVPMHVVRTLGSTAEAKRLVDVGLWREAEDGYEFHDWASRQPSREKVEAERGAARERQQKAREAAKSRRESRGMSRRDSERSSPVSHGPPVPSRPVPSVVTGSSHPPGPNANGSDDQINEATLTRLDTLLAADRTHTLRVVRDILGRANGDVRDPAGYVLRSIGDEPARYRPTPRPPRKGETCPIDGHSDWAGNCSQCASEGTGT